MDKYGEFVPLLDAHLGNGIGSKTVTMAAPLLLTSGLVRYEAVLHSCGTSPVRGDGYRLVTVHGDFIVLPHWNTRRHYKVTVTAHCHKSVSVLICPWMLL